MAAQSQVTGWLPSRVLLQAIFLLSWVWSSVAQPSNVAVDWNLITQSVVQKQQINSQIASKYYALVGLAVYLPLKEVQTDNPKNVDPTAAATYSAHLVLSTLFPVLQSPIFDPFANAQIDALNLSASKLEASRTLGYGFALRILFSRLNDGSAYLVDFKPAPPGGPLGAYEYTPGQTIVVYPQLNATRPFLIPTAKAYDTYGGPYLVGSAAYNAEVAETESVGKNDSTTRTPYQTETASFWADLSNTSAIAGHWYNIALAVLPATTSALDTAKVFAAIGVAQYDASIADWYLKFKYLFWRPITAIRRGDGVNVADPTWTPYLSTPTHPEYPSGHSGTSGGSAAVLAAYLGLGSPTQNLGKTITIGTQGGSYAPRTYNNLDTIGKEIGDSRVYGGVHFRKSVNDGLDLGYKVGDYVWHHFDKLTYDWPYHS